MNNITRGIFEYTFIETYQGKKDKFNVLTVLPNKMDGETSNYLKSEFVAYFGSQEYKRLGVTKHALDMINVKEIDPSGISAILVFRRLSINSGDGTIALVNCNENIERLITIAQIDTVLDIKEKVTDL